MANNELFYRVAREALSDENTIAELVDDLDAAVESYLQVNEEIGEGDLTHVRGEIGDGITHAQAFAHNMTAYQSHGGLT